MSFGRAVGDALRHGIWLGPHHVGAETQPSAWRANATRHGMPTRSSLVEAIGEKPCAADRRRVPGAALPRRARSARVARPAEWRSCRRG